MITSEGPKVLEFNCRFGDPETQAILPLLKSDLAELMLASIDGNLGKVETDISNEAAVCVVISSGGYPGSYDKGKVIEGLGNLDKETLAFHAGTRRKGRQITTSGGRVLGITSRAPNIGSAIERVYKEVQKVTFDGAYYRRDIGKKALKRH
jgi:phosphoribosylamine--glycine ligase